MEGHSHDFAVPDSADFRPYAFEAWVARRASSWPFSPFDVNGQVAVPADGQLKVPTPRVDYFLARVAPPRARAWRMRNESPAVTTTLA